MMRWKNDGWMDGWMDRGREEESWREEDDGWRWGMEISSRSETAARGDHFGAMIQAGQQIT